MKKSLSIKTGGRKLSATSSSKNVSLNKKGAGVVKETKGNTNQKMGIYGVAQTGPTGPNNSGINTMKKGGSINTNKKTNVMTKVKKMQAGGSTTMSSTKTNMFGKTKNISNSRAAEKVLKYANKPKSTVKSTTKGTETTYVSKPRANSVRSVSSTFKKVGGAVKAKAANPRLKKVK